VLRDFSGMQLAPMSAAANALDGTTLQISAENDRRGDAETPTAAKEDATPADTVRPRYCREIANRAPD